MPPTFTFTIEQIKQIFDAGRRQGESEATAYERGSVHHGGAFDECVEAMHDSVNHNKQFDDDGYTNYDTINGWFE